MVENYKKDGRFLVTTNNFIDAYCLYDVTLQKFKKQADQMIFLMNKALMSYKLNLKEEYGEIIRKILSLDPNHLKANYHLIKYQAIHKMTEQ
jgi:hypothetical protein